MKLFRWLFLAILFIARENLFSMDKGAKTVAQQNRLIAGILSTFAVPICWFYGGKIGKGAAVYCFANALALHAMANNCKAGLKEYDAKLNIPYEVKYNPALEIFYDPQQFKHLNNRKITYKDWQSYTQAYHNIRGKLTR